ncbi:MAG TPA: SOS response-associated peptidase [Tepidisphaeraceae bacterium]|jgi:putative SOS response-associated peptidase YedK|nr:SOS response-associated peptidase [Tepidisphaeraceae bacterium]
MCGRYTLRRVDLVRAAFDAMPTLPFEEFTERPQYNIAPSQDVAVVRVNGKGERVLGLVRWGLIPSWTKDKPKQQPINARAETIATSGMFRQAFERRRCLVPVDGFYEWRKLGDRRQPMFVHRTDDAPFAFAGLWERWRPDPDVEPVDTMTIVTTSPNALMSPIHDRMPVILDRHDYARWLDRDAPGTAVSDLLKPYSGNDLVATPVSTRVNSPRNNDCDCIAPLTDQEAT